MPARSAAPRRPAWLASWMTSAAVRGWPGAVNVGAAIAGGASGFIGSRTGTVAGGA